VSLIEEALGSDHLMALPLGELHVQWHAQGVHERVDFRGAAPSRRPQSISLDPPLPPALCLCARTTVASAILPSGSMSLRRHLNSRSQRPCFDQRKKRL
jgi:hypothetical protein